MPQVVADSSGKCIPPTTSSVVETKQGLDSWPLTWWWHITQGGIF